MDTVMIVIIVVIIIFFISRSSVEGNSPGYIGTNSNADIWQVPNTECDKKGPVCCKVHNPTWHNMWFTQRSNSCSELLKYMKNVDWNDANEYVTNCNRSSGCSNNCGCNANKYVTHQR